jgi:acyl-CoA reductase-like NAD-dependent aldehyde dehydrogenase
MSISTAEPTTLPVLNPATLEVVGEVPNSSAIEVGAAIETAQQAAPSWAASSERHLFILAVAKDLKANVMRLARLLTQEQGKPLREAMEELMGAAHWLRSVASFELPAQERISTSQGEARLERHPKGIVAAITPWNYPVILALWKIAPALLTGNCVLLKPSPFTPLTSIEIAKLFTTHLPSGVLQILTGGDDTGRHLVAHPGIDHVSFTGSVAAGRAVGALVGHNLKTATLELGGNDAAIVLEDADPAKIAEDLFKNSFKNCGQTCTAIKRIYVQHSLHRELAEALRSLADALVVGNGMQPATQMGPINNAPQLSRVQALLTDALARGGSVISGGPQIDSPGFFHRPTIVTGLPDDALLVAEEQFGPVLPLLEFDDLDDALERANQSNLGLGGSVWSADPERALEITRRLECGTTWVNRHSATDPAVPFGGVKDSGLGYANGQAGLEEFMRLRVSYPGQEK